MKQTTTNKQTNNTAPIKTIKVHLRTGAIKRRYLNNSWKFRNLQVPNGNNMICIDFWLSYVIPNLYPMSLVITAETVEKDSDERKKL